MDRFLSSGTAVSIYEITSDGKFLQFFLLYAFANQVEGLSVFTFMSVCEQDTSEAVYEDLNVDLVLEVYHDVITGSLSHK